MRDKIPDRESAFFIRLGGGLPVRDRELHEPAADRVQLGPLDPKTSRHAGQCEFVSETDPAVLRILLKVNPAWAPATAGWSATSVPPVGRLPTTPRRQVHVPGPGDGW